MKSFLVIYIFCTSYIVSSLAQTTIDPDNKKVWKLVWEDEFSYEQRSDLLKVWESANGPFSHIICSRWEENIEVGDGVVRLVNHKESRGGQDWTSGSMWTRRDFQYGYFECRYKYAAVTGTNNSFWIMTRHSDIFSGTGDDLYASATGTPEPLIGKRFEIDINEGHYPNKVSTSYHNWSDITVHPDGTKTHPKFGKVFTFENYDFSRDYHLFGLEWTEDELIYYLDRKEIRREKNSFCHSPASVLLSLALLKTDWAGPITDAIDGTFMEIDYVRVYNKKPPSSFQIDAAFPGGNIIVDSINGDFVYLRQDLRDTEGHWFYWSFRVRGTAGRTLHFNFSNGSVIGVRGPAVSTDGGSTWRWISDFGASSTKFQYTFDDHENEVYFGMGMNYTEKDLHRFLDKYSNHPDLKIETLCVSRKGRHVELLRIYNTDRIPDYKIFLSSRSHSCEMMATRSLEGIIETVLSDTEDGVWLRNHGDFFIVPFVDKDGVEDGDQGKSRCPHDHNRDYIQRTYPEVYAITEQVPQWLADKPVFVLDMHCPGLRGRSETETHEDVHFVGKNPQVYPEDIDQLHRFSTVLETVQKGTVPYRKSWNLLHGVGWNLGISHPNQLNCSGWGATLPNAIFSSTLEIPYANASGVAVDANSARELGYDLAKAIRVYLENFK